MFTKKRPLGPLFTRLPGLTPLPCKSKSLDSIDEALINLNLFVKDFGYYLICVMSDQLTKPTKAVDCCFETNTNQRSVIMSYCACHKILDSCFYGPIDF